MAEILLIETATQVCSVGIANSDGMLSLKEDNGSNYAHSSSLTVFIEEALLAANLSFSSLSAVAISRGPGSYTGLRIGVAAAKGICYALDIPLIAVDTLDGLARQCAENPKGFDKTEAPNGLPVLLCPMIDARRMEVYCALFDFDGKQILETEALVVNSSSFLTYLESHKILFFGNGAAKCASVIQHPNALFLDGIAPSAKGLAESAMNKFQMAAFEDIAYFEPFYLKDFVAGTPRVKGLN